MEDKECTVLIIMSKGLVIIKDVTQINKYITLILKKKTKKNPLILLDRNLLSFVILSLLQIIENATCFRLYYE